MNNNFKNYIELIECIEKHGMFFVPESFDWAKPIASSMPSLALDLPTVKKTARIEMVMDKKNPIYIQLSDGSRLYFSYDQFKRIEGKPERGKNLVVTMQRRQDDNSEIPSKIINCKVI